MNEKLLSMAKEAGFDSSLGEITVIHMNRHINVTNKVNKLIELAACTLPDNTELLSAAKAVIERWDMPPIGYLDHASLP